MNEDGTAIIVVSFSGMTFFIQRRKIMKQLTGNQVRQMFLDFFKSKGHMIEPGASLIPHNDPTLLWIKCWCCSIKKIF